MSERTMTFRAAGYTGPAGPARERPVITVVRVEEGPAHDVVHVWNRGGKAGTLTVDHGDGAVIAQRLFDGEPEVAP